MANPMETLKKMKARIGKKGDKGPSTKAAEPMTPMQGRMMQAAQETAEGTQNLQVAPNRRR